MIKPLIIAFLLVLFIGSNSQIQAQGNSKGIIKGKVVDEQTGDPLIGASIFVQGTKRGAKTKFDGSYIIPKVADGTYTIIVSYLGYQKKEITNIEIKSGGTASIDVTLKSASIQGEEVVVEAKAVMETGAALLAQRQKANSFSDAIGAEEISRTGGGDAADAIKKVTGATTVGGKHVFIRGLGSRYASTELNGAQLPSADPDKKSVHLDLFPSGLLENITTVKTATPDKPGDFTGGAVLLKTKSFPDRLNLNVKISSGFNTNATGQDMILGNTYTNDWTGMDGGNRAIPQIVQDIRSGLEGQFLNRFDIYGIQDVDERNAQYSLLENASRSFDSRMAPVNTTGSFNRSMSISFGNQNKVGKESAIGYLASFSYNRRFQAYNDGEWNLYQLTGSSSDELWQVQEFREYSGNDAVNWGGMFNLAYSMGANEISYNLMINQSGENRALWRSGWMETSGLNYEQGFESRANRYIERGMNSHQLRGKHQFKSLMNIKVDWMASLASTFQDEPDFRMFAYQYEAELDENDRPIIDPSTGRIMPDSVNPNYSMSPSNGYRIPSRFFREMTENLNNYSANIEIPLDDLIGSKFTFKTGFLLSRKDRNFREDLFQYETDTGRPIDDTDVDGNEYEFDPETVFDRRVGIVDTLTDGLYDYGMYINMIPSNAIYKGDQSIDAFYGMVDFFVGKKLRIIGGLRHERTDLFTQKNDDATAQLLNDTEVDIQGWKDELNNTVDPSEVDRLNNLIDNGQSLLDSLQPGFVSNDLLPSVNLVYSLTDNMNVRMAYGKTIARPNFREIANYAVEEIIGGYILNGNPFLERTLVDNYDVRWEWFVNPGEVYAVSAFYKDFTNPIQMRLGLNNNTKYVNVETGRLLGAEIEVRKNIGGLMKSAFNVDNFLLNRLQFSFNLTLTQSEVSIDPDELEFIRAFDSTASPTRPMNNQSPYVLNFDLAYVDYERGTDIGLNFNIFGDRLSIVTERGWPDIYEKPRPDVSLIASQRIYDRFRVKFSAQNLLDSRFWMTQEYNGVQYIQSQFRTGRNLSLSVSYTFN